MIFLIFCSYFVGKKFLPGFGLGSGIHGLDQTTPGPDLVRELV